MRENKERERDAGEVGPPTQFHEDTGMDLTSTGFFALAARRLAWIDQNMQVRSENIANADTPGYQRAHVQPFSSVLSEAGNLGPAATSGGDLPPLPLSDQLVPPSINGQTGDASAGVSIDNQLGKLADAEGMQNLVIRLYSATLGMFRTALDISSSGPMG